LPEKKRASLKVADTILLGAIYRALHPSSKRHFEQWAKTTTLPKLYGFDASKVTSQHFWDQMDNVSEKDIEKIEDDIIKKVAERYNLGFSVLFYDTTNFYTYIATKNKRSNLAQRGHNKQKRNDLKQFNLALLTCKDFLQNDVSVFPDYLRMMLRRLKNIISEIEDITLVFDKGNNCKEAIKILEEKRVGYVGSLSLYSHKDLIGVPYTSYHEVELSTGKKVLCYRTKKILWGKEHTILVKKTDKLKEGQIRGFLKEINKKVSLLENLREKLASPKQKQRIIDDIFGKKVFFTNRNSWSDREIIEAYHGQSKIEKLFRHLKNPYHLAVRPQFHWTDQKIKVHTFICLLGLLLVEILRKKVHDAGIKMSLDDIFNHLGNIRESKKLFDVVEKIGV